MIVGFPLQRFDDAVGGASCDLEIPPGSENRLMVRAIHASLGCGHRQLRKPRTGLDVHGVKHLGRTIIALNVVLDGQTQVARNILDERATEKNVEALNTVADRQHRFLLGEAMLEKNEIGALAVAIGAGALRMPRRSEERGIDVDGAAGEQYSIERLGEFDKVARGQVDANFDRLATAPPNSLQVAADLSRSPLSCSFLVR